MRFVCSLVIAGTMSCSGGSHRPRDAGESDAGDVADIGPRDAAPDVEDAAPDGGPTRVCDIPDAGLITSRLSCRGDCADIEAWDCAEASGDAPCAYRYNCCEQYDDLVLPSVPWWRSDPPAGCLAAAHTTDGDLDSLDACDAEMRDEFAWLQCAARPGTVICHSYPGARCSWRDGQQICSGLVTQICDSEFACPDGMQCSVISSLDGRGVCVQSCAADADCLLCGWVCGASGVCQAAAPSPRGPKCSASCECYGAYDTCVDGICMATGAPPPVVCGGAGAGQCACRGGACEAGCCRASDGHLISAPSDPRWDAVCDGV